MAYPLPGFGGPSFDARSSDQAIDEGPVSPYKRTGALRQRPSWSADKLSHDKYSSYDKYASSSRTTNYSHQQSALQVAQQNAARIVSDQNLWYEFKYTIRQRRNDVALPTTNLLTMEYLHQFVERQFELEAQRETEQEALYREMMMKKYRNNNAADQEEGGGDGRMLQKAAKWLTESLPISLIDTANLDKEREAGAAAAAAAKEHASLAISRRTSVSNSASSSTAATMAMGSSSYLDYSYNNNQNTSSSSSSSSSSSMHHSSSAGNTSKRRTWGSSLQEETEATYNDYHPPTMQPPPPSSQAPPGTTKGRPPLPSSVEAWSTNNDSNASQTRPQGTTSGMPSSTVSNRSHGGLNNAPATTTTSRQGVVPLAGILEYGEQEYEQYESPMKLMKQSPAAA